MARLTTPDWQSRVLGALVFLLAVALGVRVIAYVLTPVVPGLVAVLCLAGLLVLVLRQRR
jgi:Na+/alanine symporter